MNKLNDMNARLKRIIDKLKVELAVAKTIDEVEKVSLKYFGKTHPKIKK